MNPKNRTEELTKVGYIIKESESRLSLDLILRARETMKKILIKEEDLSS